MTSPPAPPPRRTLRGQMAEAFRLTPTRPAIMLGVRAMLATALPLVVGLELGTTASTWGILGGYNATIADKGGAYPSRALTMSGITLGCAVAGTLGALVAGHAALTVPGMLLFAFLCSLAGVYGDGPGRIGSSIAVVFAISLASPALTGTEALFRGIWIIGGGLWAMFLGLALWPVRVYRPVRYAVAACYEMLAAQAHRIAAGLSSSEEWHAAAFAQHGRIRGSVEAARTILEATRRGRRGESGRGARLHVLAEIADELFGTLSAFTNVAGVRAGDGLRAEEAVALEELGDRLAALVPKIQTERKVEPLAAARFRADTLTAELDRLDPARSSRPNIGMPSSSSGTSTRRSPQQGPSPSRCATIPRYPKASRRSG